MLHRAMEDMPKIPHVSLRENSYHFRLRVPKNIRGKFEYKGNYPNEVTKTLDTSDYKTAKTKAAEVYLYFQRLFAACEIEKDQKAPSHNQLILEDMGDNDMMLIILQWLAISRTSQEEAIINDPNTYTGEKLEEKVQDLKYDIGVYKNDLFNKHYETCRPLAERLLHQNAVKFNSRSSRFKKFKRWLTEAVIEDYYIGIEQIQNNPPPSFFNERFDSTKYEKIGQKEKGMSLGEVIQKFQNDPQENWQGSTKARNISGLELIEDFYGPATLISDIKRDEFGKFQSFLTTLPKSVRARYPRNKYTLKEAIALQRSKDVPLIRSTQRGNYLKMLKRLLTYAYDQELIDRNPVSKFKFVKDYNDIYTRLPLPDEYLIKFITDTPLYTGCKNPTARALEKGTLIPKDHYRFWVPLLSLWTGMRAGECVQLFKSDIGKEGDIDVIYIRPNKEDNQSDSEGNKAYLKRVKNKGSIRFVPIHPTLKKLGFLNFVERQKTSNNDVRLFPNCRPYKNSNSASFTRFFNERYLPHYFPNRKNYVETFHSLRHNYRDALREAELPLDVICALGGWSLDLGIQSRYGSGYKPQKLYDHIEKISYPRIDFSHLYED